MNTKAARLPLCLLIFMSVFTLSCSKKEEAPVKPAADLKGDYKGTATNQSNSADKKALTMSITSSDNPLAGTYTFAGIPGKVSGSALGLILTLTLQPDAPGNTRYTFACVADDNDTSLTGTLTGVESGTAVTYNAVVTK